MLLKHMHKLQEIARCLQTALYTFKADVEGEIYDVGGGGVHMSKTGAISHSHPVNSTSALRVLDRQCNPVSKLIMMLKESAGI